MKVVYKLSSLSAIIEILSCDRYVKYNNEGSQLPYDWLLLIHPRKTPWEVPLKIKRYGTRYLGKRLGQWKIKFISSRRRVISSISNPWLRAWL